ncbi:FHA domain-containing protein [Sphingopyxis sp. PET50]|uniref:FHA domain-containing protein n=1 Tax=Sphingopyxis sp. PET50 TaxID=2976533 RepID=UPI0021AF1AFD|nr:FHA domain-containing protein [Sphingopyxis sp. PET50]
MRPPPAGATRLVRPDEEAAPPAPAAGAAPDADKGPVVGWLVVTGGPGRGRSLELGFGMNIVGRGGGNRIVLDFGDDQISSDDHFRIAYDSQHKLFHLVPGRGTNLVYVGEQPLLSPIALTDGAAIKVGSTELRFVALCGPAWSWEG